MSCSSHHGLLRKVQCGIHNSSSLSSLSLPLLLWGAAPAPGQERESEGARAAERGVAALDASGVPRWDQGDAVVGQGKRGKGVKGGLGPCRFGRRDVGAGSESCYRSRSWQHAGRQRTGRVTPVVMAVAGVERSEDKAVE